MPRGVHPCAQPGCPTLTSSSHCPAHQPAAWQHDQTAHQRGYGQRWRKLRARILRHEPNCRHCGRPATEVDHITPKHLGGTDNPANCQPLCKKCHQVKTADEAAAARKFAPE